MFTKRQMELLSEALKKTRPSESTTIDLAACGQWNQDVVVIADVCRDSNPKFDGDKFLKACGGLL